MNDGLMGMVIGLLLGVFGTMLGLSVYLGCWFEPVAYEEMGGWESDCE